MGAFILVQAKKTLFKYIPCLSFLSVLWFTLQGGLRTHRLDPFERKQYGKMYFRITFTAFPASPDNSAQDQLVCFANLLLLVHTSGRCRMNILYTESDLQSKVSCDSRGLWKEISACLNPDIITSQARFLLGCFQNHIFHCLDQEYKCLRLELNQYLKFGCKLQ